MNVAVPCFDSKAMGARLRDLRQSRGIRLRQLAEKADCSASLLSRIENGHVTPSLATLHRLAQALGTNVVALFDAPRRESVVWRTDERAVLSTEGGAGIEYEPLLPAGRSARLQAAIHIVPPGAASDGAVTHSGEEFGYVLSGELELSVDGEVYRLCPGDAFAFGSNLPHSYRNPGSQRTRVLWVNTPPTF